MIKYLKASLLGCESQSHKYQPYPEARQPGDDLISVSEEASAVGDYQEIKGSEEEKASTCWSLFKRRSHKESTDESRPVDGEALTEAAAP